MFAPGTPDPLYCSDQLNQPLSVDVGPGKPGVGELNPLVSIVVPGAAIHMPAIPVVLVSLMSKLAIVALRKAKVKDSRKYLGILTFLFKYKYIFYIL
jgi:hypothetical protein